MGVFFFFFFLQVTEKEWQRGGRIQGGRKAGSIAY